jgi:hypothetical protein
MPENPAKPRTFAFITHEKGDWRPFRPLKGAATTAFGDVPVHDTTTETFATHYQSSVQAILFADGYVWTSLNGWLPDKMAPTRMKELRKKFAKKT